MHIGIVGTGKMGSAMTKRLLTQGHQVTVWNRTPERAQPLKELGAAVATSLPALAAAADVVISIVTDAAALRSVYEGPHSLLSAKPQGQLFIDMSTVSADTTRANGALVRAAGARYLECPVGGSVGPALEGKLLGFAGGEAADLERARPVLELLCRRLEHVGELGSGAVMKLAINLPLMVYWQTLSEALSLLQPLGLDPKRVVDILADTSGGPNMLKVRGPMIAQALAGQPGGVTVNVATMRKDLKSMLDQGTANHYQLPVTSLVLKTFEQAGQQGLDEADCTQLLTWWLQGAGKA